MATVTLGGSPSDTNGTLPEIGMTAPEFVLTSTRLQSRNQNDYRGKRKILNIFPSVDTGVCSASVRKFNEKAAQLKDSVVLCISRDLPFAQQRFCAAEGLEHVEMLSDFKTGEFGKRYGLEIIMGPFQGLHSRVVMVLDEDNRVLYSEQVSEIDDAPDYESALKAIM